MGLCEDASDLPPQARARSGPVAAVGAGAAGSVRRPRGVRNVSRSGEATAPGRGELLVGQDRGGVSGLIVRLVRDRAGGALAAGGVVAAALSLAGCCCGGGGGGGGGVGFAAARTARRRRMGLGGPGGPDGELAVARRRELVPRALGGGDPAAGRADLRGGRRVTSPGAVAALGVEGRGAGASAARAGGGTAISCSSPWRGPRIQGVAVLVLPAPDLASGGRAVARPENVVRARGVGGFHLCQMRLRYQLGLKLLGRYPGKLDCSMLGYVDKVGYESVMKVHCSCYLSACRLTDFKHPSFCLI